MDHRSYSLYIFQKHCKPLPTASIVQTLELDLSQSSNSLNLNHIMTDLFYTGAKSVRAYSSLGSSYHFLSIPLFNPSFTKVQRGWITIVDNLPESDPLPSYTNWCSSGASWPFSYRNKKRSRIFNPKLALPTRKITPCNRKDGSINIWWFTCKQKLHEIKHISSLAKP